MTNQSEYGVIHRQQINDGTEARIEELQVLGFTILENAVSASDLSLARSRLDAVYVRQEKEFGRERLEAIGEKNLARCPLAYDDWFVTLATHEAVLRLASQLLGEFFQLHLQNGIINLPDEAHHQSAWHRDLPYQEFVISRPLAMSALFCIDAFTVETGATKVLPFSHRLAIMPSEGYVERHAVTVEAAAGSVILFDAMLFHRAGHNRSNIVRRGVNHVYTSPIIRQQIDLPQQLDGTFADDPKLARLLGYSNPSPASVLDYRQQRWRRKSAQEST